MALSKAKIKIREANSNEDFIFIADIARENRVAFDESGEATELEAFVNCDYEKYRLLHEPPYNFRVFIGIVSGEMAGFLITKHHAPHPAIPGHFDSIVYAVCVSREFRGSKLFSTFHQLSIELWKASGDQRLVCWTRFNGELIPTIKRMGWVEKRVELQYEPSAGAEKRLQIDSCVVQLHDGSPENCKDLVI
jgi:hypothetical protein